MIQIIDGQHRRVAARIALHAHRVHRNDQAFRRGAHRRVPLRTQAADGQTRPREWMTVQQFRGQTQFAAHLANLVLVKGSQGFHDSSALDQFLNAGHPIVMGLDQRRLGAAPRFNSVRVDGPLAQDPVGQAGWPVVHPAVVQAQRLDDALLNAHEFLADNVPLLLRIGDALERAQEPLRGVLHGNAGHAADEIGLAFAHQARIHVHAAHPLRSQRARAQREGDARIHSAAHEEEYVAAAHAVADFLLQERRPMPRVPILFAAAYRKGEVGKVLLAARGVNHFQVKLHGVELPLGSRDGSHRASLCAAGHGESFGQPAHHIAVTHPHLLGPAQAGEHRVGYVMQLERGQTVLALVAPAHFAPQQVCHQLLAVADAEHRRAQREDGGVHGGTLGIVDAARPAGNDDAPGQGQFRGGSLAHPNLGIHSQVANFARDQMAVLSARVQDDNLSGRVQVTMVSARRATYSFNPHQAQ